MNERLRLEWLVVLLMEYVLGMVKQAHRSGLSYDLIWQTRMGAPPQSTAEQVQRLANALGTTKDYLLGLSDEKTARNANTATRRLEDEVAVWLWLDGVAEPVRASTLPEIMVTLRASSDVGP
ncbi:MAG: hypothetical protein GX604_06695 [Actinobacteria bacterium]|nr:hypothetical protein [Actinomycetota bacterium]